MGYRGHVELREQARLLRAEASTLAEIALALGVARSTVSVWVRDVPFTPKPRNRGAARQRPHPQHTARLAEIEALRTEAVARIGELSTKELLIAGAALYAGEGAKRDGAVRFTNTDPRMVLFFVNWLRQCFTVEETRLRLRLYLHEGLDLGAAVTFWSELTLIPPEQFTKPYRAVADSSIRSRKHPLGCPAIIYSCSHTHRAIMGLVDALLSCPGAFRGSAIGSAADC
jgi:hypothetical protein